MNTNLLAGLACPDCGSTEPLDIEARCTVTMYDESDDNARAFQWDDGAPCSCGECGYSGNVSDFRIVG